MLGKPCEKCAVRIGDGVADLGTHDGWICKRCWRTLNDRVFHPELGEGRVTTDYWWFWRFYYIIVDIFNRD